MSFFSFFLFFVCFFLLLSLTIAHEQALCLTIDVQLNENTTLRGCLGFLAPSVAIFHLRYASLPPRWSYSEPLSLSSSSPTIIDATAAPPQCYQNFPPFASSSSSSAAAPPFGTESEDCLYVSIWVPTAHLKALSSHKQRGERQKADLLPILFYIPGGAFQMLAGIDGERWLFLTEKLIVVSVQYRVNLFGFFSTPGLTSESSSGLSSGNYGLHDQVTALQWLHENIANVAGGDAKRITIAGQSAGSMSVCHHLVSPLSRDLFARAILESGACTNDLRTRDEQQAIAQAFASTDAIGCQLREKSEAGYAAQLTCLRNVSAASLQSVQSTFVWDSIYANEQFRPVVDDGYVIKQKPKTYFEQGTWNKVPLIAGSVAHEIGFMIQNDVSGLFDSVTWSNWSLTFRTLINENITTSLMTPELNDYYSEKNQAYWNVTSVGTSGNNAPFNALFDAASTFKFQCPNYFVGRFGSSSGLPVYVYTFNYASVNCTQCSRFGAIHGAELPYVYYQSQGFGPVAGSVDLALSLSLSQYWIRFIVSDTADPNDVNAGVNIAGANTSLVWPRLIVGSGADEPELLEITTTADVVISKDYHTTACKLWEEL